MVSFIHTGDIHLGMKFTSSSLGGYKGKIRREELWQTFGDMIKYAKAEKKDMILIAGDLFENDAVTLKDLKRLSDIFESASEQLIIILPGNHDPNAINTSYSTIEWPENVKILKNTGLQEIHFDDLKTSIWGLTAKRDLNEILIELKRIKPKYEYSNILMLHGEIGSSPDYPIPDINKLTNLSMDYIALGHIHKPSFINKNIAYCGSLEPLDFGETNERGFIEGELSDLNKFRFIPFSKRKFHIIELDSNEEMSIDKVIQDIKELTGERRQIDFYRVILKGILAMHFDIEALEAQLKREFFHIELINKAKPGINIEKILKENQSNILGKYIESFTGEDMEDPITKDAFYLGVYSLLEGSNLV